MSSSMPSRQIHDGATLRSRAGRRLLWTLLLLLGAVPTACGPGADAGGDPATRAEGPHGDFPGPLVIIGGALDPGNEAIYRVILEGREGAGPLCVIPTAGADPEASMASAAERFEHWGGQGTARGILLSVEVPERAGDPDVVDALRGCSGFFFTGGVQSRILQVFRPDGKATPAIDALMERWREGAVVAGSSAGAAMMSDPMIAGGSSEGAFRDGVTWASEGEGVQLEPGMGFLADLLVDQHFLARGRIGRLLAVVVENEGVRFGAGVDENTALVVHEGWGQVVGASGVVWVDGRGARPGRDGAHMADSGLRMELLGDGDRVEMATGRVVPAEGKGALHDEADPPASRPTASEGDDPFQPWVLLHRLEEMARTGGEVGWEGVAGYHLRLVPAPDFRGVAWPGAGVQGTRHGLSVGPLEVRIDATDLPGDGTGTP